MVASLDISTAVGNSPIGFSTVCMVGLGYIGLPTAAVMASRGLQVIGVDVDETAVDTINRGNVHIVEPDLDIVVRSVVTTGNLKATTTPEAADAFLIAVPTPLTVDHEPDLKFVEAAARSIASVLRPGNLIVLESTSPVGTTEKLCAWLAAFRTDLTFPDSAGDNADIKIAYCPERVLPGHVLQELVNNDRVVGGLSRCCSELAVKLYQLFVKGDCFMTTARTAELCKLTENAYRDTNIAFANEMSLVCDQLGVSVWELIELSNLHPRVNILQPGPGVGGHCIAVDPWFLVSSAPDVTPLIRTARNVNHHKPDFIVNKVMSKVARFKQPIIACFGLAFKANIDDLRESPAVEIVKQLASQIDGELYVVEPNIARLPAILASQRNITLSSISDALQHADIALGLVDHREFREMSVEDLDEKITIDTRGMWRRN